MALDLKFRISLSSDGENLTITDTTNSYSGTFLGGWGSPNPEIADALTATVTISKRAADGTYGDEIEVDVFDDLPSAVGGTYVIAATDGVDAATYSDGIYKLVYNVTGSSSGTPFNSSVTRYDTLRNSIATCYQTKSANYSACDCNCGNLSDQLKCMSLLMRLLKGAESCGDLDEIQKYLDKLTAICNDNCGCS